MSNSYEATVLADSPIGYYRLNESSGTTANDSSGNSNNGTYNASPTLGVAGLLIDTPDTGDNAVTFARASSQYVSLPTSMVPTGAHAWSLECWFKVPSAPSSGSHQTLMGWGANTGNQKFGVLNFTSNGTTFQVVCSTNSGDIASGNLSASTVYHVVGTYDGTSTRLYVNGSLVAGPTNFTLSLTQTLCCIAAYTPGAYSSSFFNGTIDEAAFYTTALSSTQVSAHYNAGRAITHLLGVRTLLSVLAIKSLGMRTRLSVLATKTLGARTRLRVLATKSVGLRTRLSLLATKSMGAITRLSVLATKSLGVRTRLLTAATKSVGVRTLLRVLTTKTVGVRLVLHSFATKSAGVRTRLSVLVTKTLGARTRLSVLVTKSVGVRAVLHSFATKSMGAITRLSVLATKSLGVRTRLFVQYPTKTVGVRVRLAGIASGKFACWANGTGTASFDHFRATQYPDPALSLAPVLQRLGNATVVWDEMIPTNGSRTIKTSLDGVNWTDVSSQNGGSIPGLTGQPDPIIDYFNSNTSANYTNTSKSGGSAATVTYDTANSRVTLSGGSGGLYLYTAISDNDVDIIADMDESDSGGIVWRFVDTNNYYELGAYDDSSSGGFTNQLRLYKVVSGTRSLIGSASTIVWPRS